MFRNEKEKNQFLSKSTFDEATYYLGTKFQIGGTDRKPLTYFNQLVAEHTRSPVVLAGQRSDERILEDAWNVLRKNYKIDLSGLDLAVEKGTVCLSGSVSLISQKHEAESMLEHLPGVVSVVNNLIVSKLQ